MLQMVLLAQLTDLTQQYLHVHRTYVQTDRVTDSGTYDYCLEEPVVQRARRHIDGECK
jgi:hypothetical protein